MSCIYHKLCAEPAAAARRAHQAAMRDVTLSTRARSTRTHAWRTAFALSGLNRDVGTLVFDSAAEHLHRYPQSMNQRVVPIHRDGGGQRFGEERREAMMDNAEIIELARLQLAVDSAPGDELLMKQFEDGLKRLESDPAGYMLLQLAYKLLSACGAARRDRPAHRGRARRHL